MSIADDFLEAMKAGVPATVEKPKKIYKAEFVDSVEMVPLAKEEGSTELEKAFNNVYFGEKNSLTRLAYGQTDQNKTVKRTAFQADPTLSRYGTNWLPKQYGIPNEFLKKMASQDDLVAHIIQCRCHQVLPYFSPRVDRFSPGYLIEPNVGVLKQLNTQQLEEFHKRVERATKLFLTCGSEENLKTKDRASFAQWAMESVRNALTIGSLATEVLWTEKFGEEQKKFHSFRSIDSSTVYKASKENDTRGESTRELGLQLLADLRDEPVQIEKTIPKKEYSWYQVIKGNPRMAWAADECLVYNFYPSNDVELAGYPVAPLDSVVNHVITHVSIVAHNKMYFQNGRAARGMLLVKGDDVDGETITRIKHQFMAAINSVQNSHRMPIFQVPTDGEITWQPIDNSSRDAEFQYLTDQNARVILSAFQIAPEELSAWSYLSRGTASQGQGESTNEWKQEAARDLGIRPLLAKFEDFINKYLFPLIDPALAKVCRFRLFGLDAETPEKESVRYQQDMPVHGTYDWIMEGVEKDPVGPEMMGTFPMNPQYQSALDKYIKVGKVVAFFTGNKEAETDPDLQYIRDPFWFNYQNLLLQKTQIQQAAQPPQGPPGADGGGGDAPAAPPQNGDQGPPAPATDDDRSDAQKDAHDQQSQQAQMDANNDLARSSQLVDQAIQILTKSEDKLDPKARRLLALNRKVVTNALESWDKDLEEATKEILKVATSGQKRKPKTDG